MHLVVDADKRGKLLNLKELFHYKDLFYILAYRDLRVRYAQTFLGLFWLFLQLLATLALFTIGFESAIRITSESISTTPFMSINILLLPAKCFVDE